MNVDVTQHELNRYPTFTFSLGNGNGTESKVLLYSTVHKWAALFVAGRETIENDPRSVRPITAHSEASIEIVRHSNYDKIEALSSISRGTIQSIKITSQWVPHC